MTSEEMPSVQRRKAEGRGPVETLGGARWWKKGYDEKSSCCSSPHNNNLAHFIFLHKLSLNNVFLY